MKIDVDATTAKKSVPQKRVEPENHRGQGDEMQVWIGTANKHILRERGLEGAGKKEKNAEPQIN